MTNWKEYKLSDFMEINPKVQLKSGQSYSFVEMKDLADGQKFVLPEQERELKGGSRFENGDTLFARITPCLENGKICQVKELKNGKGYGSTEFLVFRGKHGISDTDFVFYLSRYDEVRRFAEQNMVGTSGRQRVSWQAFENLSLSLPDMPTQTAIAEILSSLDDKIELNNKINQELENLAQTLFKEWFIDFEFPDENGNSYKSSGGKMVDSELGEIPKGWEVKTLKDEFILNMGQSPKGDTYNEVGEGIVFFQGRSDFGFRFPSIRMYTSDPKKIAKKFETLISVRAPVGDINMAETDCCIGRGLGSIAHPKNYFSYTYYKTLSIQGELKSYDNEGTVFGSINKETLGNIKSIIPPINLIQKFNSLIEDKDSLIYNVSCENQELTVLRDTLLPKLISGVLEIKNVNV
ncbi:MAG: restriction endonuclease subunit S [Saprospiraceae bacterium]|jgi:type I restriction enzyme S subunit|nr:restriction endonuclease subunit S [Saprospiraceae bacterium]